jgi:Septum formation
MTLRYCFALAIFLSLPACQPSSSNANKVITDMAPVKNDQPLTEPVSKVKSTKMDIGDCFITEVEIGNGKFDQKLVDCAKPHTMEVYSRLILSEKEYPGRQVIIDTANQHCESALDVHVKPQTRNVYSTYQPIFPSPESWSEDHDIFCLYMEYEARNEDRRKLITGSVLTPSASP